MATPCMDVSKREAESSIPPRGVKDESIDRFSESRRVYEGEEDEASSEKGEAGGDTLRDLEPMKLCRGQ